MSQIQPRIQSHPRRNPELNHQLTEAMTIALKFLMENPDYLPNGKDAPEKDSENLERKRLEPDESAGKSSKSKLEPPTRQATLEEMPAVVRTPHTRETCKPDSPLTGEPSISPLDGLTTTEEPPRKCLSLKCLFLYLYMFIYQF